VNQISKRLGWEASILNCDGGKPKGMHWKTYPSLISHHDSLVQVSFHDIKPQARFSAQVAGGVDMFRKMQPLQPD